MELDEYRAQAEAFYAELDRAYYRHYAGHDPEFALEAIYGRHAALFTRDAVLSLHERVEAGAPGEDERVRRRLLWDFALDGHLGQLTKGIEAELARREMAISVPVPGAEPVGFRESSIVQANEPDADTRAAIEDARHAATAGELGDLYRELTECQHATAREFGFASYRDMCAQAKGLDLQALHAQTSAFVAATDGLLDAVLDGQLRRSLDVGMDGLRRSDIPRFRRAPADDPSFPAAALVPSFMATMGGLGIDPAAQPGVVLDLDSRPGKTPRAFCAAPHAPHEVYLVLTPIGGREDYAILFHEAGHTEQFAHIAPELTFEFRALGDAAATEAFAFLFQHLTDEPAWLARHLRVTDCAPLVDYARANRFLYLRLYTAKLAYELELHGGGGLDEMPSRYSALLGSAVGTAWDERTFLCDVDPGFYCAGYLRAWAFEAQLRGHLRERFGETWFEVDEAGELLRAAWRDGLRYTAEEMLQRICGETLDFGVLLGDLGLAP